MVVINLVGVSEAAFEDNVWRIFSRVYLKGPLNQIMKESVSWYSDERATEFLITNELIETLKPEPTKTQKGQGEAGN
jgi:hypothetical protein